MLRMSLNNDPTFAGAIWGSNKRIEFMHSDGVHGHKFESWFPVSRHKGFEITTLRRACGRVVCQSQAGIRDKDGFRFHEHNKPMILAISNKKAQKSIVEKVHLEGLRILLKSEKLNHETE